MNQQEQDLFQLMVTACDEIDRSTNPSCIFYRAKRFIRDATKGAEHSHQEHGVFALAQCITSPDPNLERFRMVTMPASMLEQRWRADDFAHDPVISLAGKHSNPFTWAEANEVTNTRGRYIAHVCEEHTGQKDGFVFPMMRLGCRRGLGSVGLDVSPDHFSPTETMMIRVVVEKAYFRVDALLGPFSPDEVGEPLSVRELDLLRRIADGMTAAEAAAEMGVTKATAANYLERAKRKTGTRRTAHTVKVALTSGMMLP